MKNFKNVFLLGAVAMGLVAGVIACKDDDKDNGGTGSGSNNGQVTSIKLNKEMDSLYVDSTLVLTPTIKPENATDKSVGWSTSNSSIATVTDEGVVKGIKDGVAIISCTAKDGGEATGKCYINVYSYSIVGTWRGVTDKSGDAESIVVTFDGTGQVEEKIEGQSDGHHYSYEYDSAEKKLKLIDQSSSHEGEVYEFNIRWKNNNHMVLTYVTKSPDDWYQDFYRVE